VLVLEQKLEAEVKKEKNFAHVFLFVVYYSLTRIEPFEIISHQILVDANNIFFYTSFGKKPR